MTHNIIFASWSWGELPFMSCLLKEAKAAQMLRIPALGNQLIMKMILQSKEISMFKYYAQVNPLHS